VVLLAELQCIWISVYNVRSEHRSKVDNDDYEIESITNKVLPYNSKWLPKRSTTQVGDM